MIILLAQFLLLSSFSTVLKAEEEKWYWPLWNHDDPENEIAVLHLSRGYSEKHQALDIAPTFEEQTVEVRAAERGTVVLIMSGCHNEDGYFSGPCQDADKGCKPSKTVLKGYDGNDEQIVEVTENNFHSSSKSHLYGYCNTGLGNAIGIEHEDGTCSFYAHLSDIEVRIGQIVRPGDVIGLCGSTGYSTGRHLHFALFGNKEDMLTRKNGLNSNPISSDYHITLDEDEEGSRDSDGFVYDPNGTEYTFENNRFSLKIDLKEWKVDLVIGDTYQIEPNLINNIYSAWPKFTYHSMDETVVKTDQNGLLEAVGEGKTLIVVNCFDATAFLEVNVSKPQPEKKSWLQKIIDFIRNLIGRRHPLTAETKTGR